MRVVVTPGRLVLRIEELRRLELSGETVRRDALDADVEWPRACRQGHLRVRALCAEQRCREIAVAIHLDLVALARRDRAPAQQTGNGGAAGYGTALLRHLEGLDRPKGAKA